MCTYRPQTGGWTPLRTPRSVNTSREVSERRALQGPPLCFYLSTSSPINPEWLAQVAHRPLYWCMYLRPGAAQRSAAHLLLNNDSEHRAGGPGGPGGPGSAAG